MRWLGVLLVMLLVPSTAQAAVVAEATINGAQYRLEVADGLQDGDLVFTGTKPGHSRQMRVPLATGAREITAVAEVDCEHGGLVLIAGSVSREMGRIQAKLEDGQRLEVTRIPTPTGAIIALLAPARFGVLYIGAYDDQSNRLGVLRPNAVRPCNDSRPIDPGLLDGSIQRAHDAARARWRRTTAIAYRMRVRCTGCARRPTRVEHLFNEIQREIDRRPGRLVIKYGAYGVPRRFIGDLVSFDVTRFHAG
jgi:hypothetical protein